MRTDRYAMSEISASFSGSPNDAAGLTVRLTRDLNHPIERVWTALTNPDDLAAWLMDPSVLELHVGGAIGFAEPDMGPAGHITQLEPPTLIEYTWHTRRGAEASIVRFELTPSDGGTRLTLTHRQNATRSDALEHGAGWHTHLEWLHATLDGSERTPFWERYGQMLPQFEALLSSHEQRQEIQAS